MQEWPCKLVPWYNTGEPAGSEHQRPDVKQNEADHYSSPENPDHLPDSIPV
jgi:hypothetical protein